MKMLMLFGLTRFSGILRGRLGDSSASARAAAAAGRTTRTGAWSAEA